MTIKVVNIIHYDGEYIPIHRGTIWGNPYVIGIDGDRNEVIEKYEKHIRSNTILLAELPNLENEVLVCFCKPKRCHGDIIIKLLKERRILNDSKICDN